MRIFIVIILLSIHLFSIGVYCGIFSTDLQEQAQLEKHLCTDRARKDMLELKIPVHAPGAASWGNYEQVLGKLELKDAEYTYVRLKMSRDTMSLLCFQNTKKLPTVRDNIIDAKNIADVPVGKKAHNTSAKKTLDTQFNSATLHHQFSGAICYTDNNMFRSLSMPLSPYIETAGQPPDHSC